LNQTLIYFEYIIIKLYPDYYEIIKKPIDLKEIARRVLNSLYENLAQMEADLLLMTDNAKRYNEPKSMIYKDANKLKVLIRDTGKELGSLMRANKQRETSKTREKKIKLLEEIAEVANESESTLSLITAPSGDRNSIASNEEELKKDVEMAAATTTAASAEPDHEQSEEEESAGEEDETMNKSGESDSNKKNKNTLISAMWSLFDFLKDYRHGSQTIIDPFVKLPSKRAYPDYYEEIKNPIALSIIKTKLNKRRYANISQLIADFELLFKNAMQYNQDTSLIYANAKKLLEVLKQKSGELSVDVLEAGLPVAATKSPTTPSKRGPKPHSPNKNEKQTTPSINKITKSGVNMLEHNLKRLFKLVLDYCEEDKPKSQIDKKVPGAKSNKVVPLSEHFMALPKPEIQPEYYEKVITGHLKFLVVRDEIKI
jgi:protein polybromo-1